MAAPVSAEPGGGGDRGLSEALLPWLRRIVIVEPPAIEMMA